MSLVNPEDNPCYFKYTLEVAGASDILYESDLIRPGTAITEFAVSNLPDAGTMTCILISVRTPWMIR